MNPQRITRKSYEHKILEVCGNHRNIHKEKHVEHDGQIVWLYYIDDVHAGSWTTGRGWIFSEEKYEQMRESIRKFNEKFPDMTNNELFGEHDNLVHS